LNVRDIENLQRRFAKKAENKAFFKKDKLLATYRSLLAQKIISKNKTLERLLMLKQVRSLSGIVVVSILCKPYPCPGKCIYCPTKSGVPKSYDPNEPAVARAIICNYDPYIQVQNRLTALKNIGHPIDKINIRIIGGTWSFYPKNYQTWFIKKIYQAVNEFGTKRKNIRTHERMNNSLERLQQKNERAKYRIVEISIETRQDFINEKEIKRLRSFGVTKIELGVQSLYDDVLKLNKRGHDIKTTIKATKVIRDAGFKVACQMMGNLPGSNLSHDKEMFKKLFDDSNFRPDYLKIYPLALIKNTGAYKLYQNKKFRPYTRAELLNLIRSAKEIVPYYTRIERVIRDIPTDSIVEGGSKITNLRQILKQKGTKCRCIRCREIKEQKRGKYQLFIEEYEANEGKEYFLSFENKSRTKLYSILRLRIPSQFFADKNHFISVLNKAAIIREIHTYGRQIQISKSDKEASQHHGLGRKLIKEAENIAKNFGLKKIAVISGVGVRDYFRKLNFKLRDNYMVKKLN